MSVYPSLPDDGFIVEHNGQLEQPHSLLPSCSVCLEEFTENRLPKYLSCHHTFCKDCIQHLLNSGKVHCPLCRELTNVTSVNFLQTNNDVLTMAKYGNVFINLWCHDCEGTPKATCLTHRVSNQSPGSHPTLGQQVDNTVEAWTPAVMRVVETTHGLAVVIMDATYSTITNVSDFMAPIASYITDWFSSVLSCDNP